MDRPLVVSAGMPRAGSGWFYNLVHDLLVTCGGQDARSVRKRYRLSHLLTEVNCNISTLKSARLIPVQVPTVFGNWFAIKTHAGPSSYALWANRRNLITIIYIYRDPRAAMLSAYEYGQRTRSNDRGNAFSELTTLDEAAQFMLSYTKIWDAWALENGIFKVRYEDLVNNFDAEFKRLTGHLGIEKDQRDLASLIDSYRPGMKDTQRKGLHFSFGQIARFRDVYTPRQLQEYTQVFEPYLERMGYSK